MPAEPESDKPSPVPTETEEYEGLRLLHPHEFRVEREQGGGLRMVFHDGTEFRHVRVYRTQPITEPDKYISFRHGYPQEHEIGVLPDLNQLEPQQRAIVVQALGQRYLTYTVRSIRAITEKFGFLYWEVETDRDIKTFHMPRWGQRHVVEVGHHGEGRMITDTYGNRYFIPSFTDLDHASRQRFLRYIYW